MQIMNKKFIFTIIDSLKRFFFLPHNSHTASPVYASPTGNWAGPIANPHFLASMLPHNLRTELSAYNILACSGRPFFVMNEKKW